MEYAAASSASKPKKQAKPLKAAQQDIVNVKPNAKNSAPNNNNNYNNCLGTSGHHHRGGGAGAQTGAAVRPVAKKKFKLPEGQSLLLKSKYVITKKIGNGSFGEIYLANNIVNKNQVAVKVEPFGVRPQLLPTESKVYQVLGNCPGVPKFYWYGIQNDFNFLVMELLGPSLEELFNLCKRKFSIKTVLMIADQLVALIEVFHSKNFIHRDIKPDNFLIGLNQNCNKIYIVDFGLSKEYRKLKESKGLSYSRNYEHIEYTDGRSLAGTARYVSINAHKGIEQTRRDDLESCCYVLIYFTQGALPWQGFRGSTKQSKYNQIYKCKSDTSIEILCKPLPKEFNLVLTYCRKLKFDETPDYSYIRQLFRILLRTLDYNNDRIFDWNQESAASLLKPSLSTTCQTAAKIT